MYFISYKFAFLHTLSKIPEENQTPTILKYTVQQLSSRTEDIKTTQKDKYLLKLSLNIVHARFRTMLTSLI
jgi:hypothetical protein